MQLETRPAVPEDADLLAFLVNEAGEGIPMLVWQGMAQPGESAMDVGRRRARRETGAFSYRNAVMATVDGQAAGALVDYRLGGAPEPIGPETPPLFVPLCELENEACGSWYVNVLAVAPELRGRGVGRFLLGVAERRARAAGAPERRARAAGAPELSIIVSDGNRDACRLYERAGFIPRAERPMVAAEGWDRSGTAWRLLAKPVD